MRTLFLLLLLSFYGCISDKSDLESKKADETEGQIIRYDRKGAPILYGVEIPRDKKWFISSGIVADIKDSTASEKDIERYGDTYTQSISIFKKLNEILQNAGLGLKDIIKLNVYIARDSVKGSKVDFKGFFDAYDTLFNNEKNPNKAARTTLGVEALAREGLLVEIEAIAVYPEALIY